MNENLDLGTQDGNLKTKPQSCFFAELIAQSDGHAEI